MTFVPMPFDQMIPALEAGKVDAILTRGGHALLAVGEGHPVLYQNWNVEGGDECCPKTLAQIELILVARADGARGSRLRDVVSALELGSSVSAGELRAAAARRTRIPLAALEPFPVASFVALTPEQQAELGGGALEEEADEHDHDCEHEGCSAATHQNGD